MAVVDRWHKKNPKPSEVACEHDKVPTNEHGKGKRWQVRYRDAQGNQRSENHARKPDAESRDKILGADLLRGTFLDPANAKITFRDFAEDHRGNRVHDVTTATRLESLMRNHVYPTLGDRTLRELANRPSLLQAWISGLALEGSTARNLISEVSTIFHAAVDDGLINRNPLRLRSIRKPAVKERKAKPWTLEQVEAMADALDERYAVIPYLGAGTGMRQGEMFGLAVDDIDFLRRIVRIRRQVRLVVNAPVFYTVKNDKAHDVPLIGSLAARLSEHIRVHPPVTLTLPWREPGGKPATHRLLLSRPGEQAMHKTIFNNRRWKPALRQAGIPATRRNGCHALRHTAASSWLAEGIDIATVAEYLGDTVAMVHKTYAHMMPNRTDRARKAMEQFFQPPAPEKQRVIRPGDVP